MSKKILCIALAMFLAVSFCSCIVVNYDAPPSSASSSSVEQNSSEEYQQSSYSDPDTDLITGTVYGVFDESNIKEHDFGYEDGDCDPVKIAEALSDWTGLIFSVSFEISGDGSYLINWESDSSLVTGFMPENQGSEFHFLDSGSLRWFMLNSLCYSIRRNMPGDVDVYYSANSVDLNDLELDYNFHPSFPYNSIENPHVIA